MLTLFLSTGIPMLPSPLAQAEVNDLPSIHTQTHSDKALLSNLYLWAGVEQELY